jgi:hypothetical protein
MELSTSVFPSRQNDRGGGEMGGVDWWSGVGWMKKRAPSGSLRLLGCFHIEVGSFQLLTVLTNTAG